MSFLDSDRDPRKHVIVERSNEKVNLHLIRRMIDVYDWLVLSAIIDAILLKTTVAVGPMPPIVLKINGGINGIHTYIQKFHQRGHVMMGSLTLANAPSGDTFRAIRLAGGHVVTSNNVYGAGKRSLYWASLSYRCQTCRFTIRFPPGLATFLEWDGLIFICKFNSRIYGPQECKGPPDQVY